MTHPSDASAVRSAALKAESSAVRSPPGQRSVSSSTCGSPRAPETYFARSVLPVADAPTTAILRQFSAAVTWRRLWVSTVRRVVVRCLYRLDAPDRAPEA